MGVRKNARNEVLHLRILLSQACRVLEAYYPELMPREVRNWWTGEKVRKGVKES